MKKDFIALNDFSSSELEDMLNLAGRIKKSPEDYLSVLKGKTLAMIFNKKSTRTRISFEVGIFQLGGMALFLGPGDMQLARGETIADTGKVLSRFADGIMLRTFSHGDILELARQSTVPVINGLTDFNHPCQALADMMTVREKFGKLAGLKLAYVGDSNNVTVSLLSACVKLGLHITLVSPKGYTITKEALDMVREEADSKNLNIVLTEDVAEGVAGAHVIYTDVWTSMGQEEERQKRLKDLAGYTVDEAVMKAAGPQAVFMHCLPAHRGEEVSASVIDGPASIVFDQAENRLHLQKAVMVTLMQ
ncbi:MAG: ornithine carbamoyltransferase [Nitrospinaceae bacterium]|nr:ornithine carbamoyltransferase [Nitrospinaceae bacterium]NIR54455.1 ornithine carbamoyltransferase [Nitrospinaceae bacterium]NIS84874.1 ornithine carbamoyltransferase [Nitrospinaceae bacterium]NIT81686.1 ornithine carbamoyltransferase [Nitrospinaceae bacterium]NIU43957.1 ornithine carbamoyltransferase [Nitrospinaceae bacterium]